MELIFLSWMRIMGVLEDRLHPLRIRHEVGREVAAVELHALDRLEGGLEALGLLDRDDAVLADLLHGVGDEVADSASLLAEMAPTWAISFLPLVSIESFLSSATTTSTALSMPRGCPWGSCRR
jgi:hypothetical protein